jgi:hypothetical protein
MTPDRPRIDWLFIAVWFVVLFAALSFACVIGAGIVALGQRILAALWPFFLAHSNGLTLGIGIAVVLALFVAVTMEGKRR